MNTFLSWLVLPLLLVAVALDPTEPSEVEPGRSLYFHSSSTVSFAPAERGREFLGTTDAWVRSFGPMDRQVRLQSEELVSEASFLEFAASQVGEWEDAEMAKVTSSLLEISKMLGERGLDLPLPPEIILIKTSGREEGNAGGYTRRNAIIVPVTQIGRQEPVFRTFLLHELFHVMTRHDPEIRIPLYRIIGFEPCNDIEYPESLLPRKITNPDAFHFDSFVELFVDGSPVSVIPLTLSKADTYGGGGIFDIVRVEFLRVSRLSGIMKPHTRGRQPLLYSMSEVEGYYEKIGRNTNYVIHPEEIMADNFALAVMGKKEVPNPEILDRLLEVLSSLHGSDSSGAP